MRWRNWYKRSSWWWNIIHFCRMYHLIWFTLRHPLQIVHRRSFHGWALLLTITLFGPVYEKLFSYHNSAKIQKRDNWSASNDGTPYLWRFSALLILSPLRLSCLPMSLRYLSKGGAFVASFLAMINIDYRPREFMSGVPQIIYTHSTIKTWTWWQKAE